MDTQDPALIRAALFRADLVLSLQEANIPKVGKDVARAGAAAVVVPGGRVRLRKTSPGHSAPGSAASLPIPSSSRSVQDWSPRLHSLRTMAARSSLARETWPNSSMQTRSASMRSLPAWQRSRCLDYLHERTLGQDPGFDPGDAAGNRDDGSHRDRPYPKDLGIGLLVLKEKRRRREPPLEYETHIPARRMPDEITYDPKGNFRIGIEGDQIVAVINGKAVKGEALAGRALHASSQGVTSRSSTMQDILAREMYKAELAIRYGRSFEQDGEF